MKKLLTKEFRPYQYTSDDELLHMLKSLVPQLNSLFVEMNKHRRRHIRIDYMDSRRAEEESYLEYVPYVNVHVYRHEAGATGTVR